MRRTLSFLSHFAIGALFGVGLLISGMTNPQKILNFLDLAGAWDPSLICVMGGAVLVGLVGFNRAKKRPQSWWDGAMHLPQRRDFDRRLLLGSAVFGIGWGIAGFCPGPALVALGGGEIKAVIFVLAMIAGMGIFQVTQKAS